ncbi:response regulator MprA [Oxobacter pfennigii]|uniref:Stage 0 sporulation protein A homolog n=1 Tax=Oxobacter pfennigii TaxID=36849 RepID=A0A0P8YEX7_9CLOT|nr:response regulator [Oxobacter pfennigii]KPU45721.1 response regulator MprA [Oxobacter pfennigii]
MAKKVLVIDDVKNIRTMVAKALTLSGYAVDTAENGYEGLNFLKDNDYDVVLLDIRMPGFSGTEVLKSIREIKKDVPVIIMTAYPTIKNAVDCIKMGAVEYLRKPFTPDKIKSTIEQVINGNKN